ncbi:hypothetical protein PHAMO_190029 [Magnetospirillum molischianum DSM 120]|uniref:Uncharacterized protein n=1 Tax=Magnetospirillum molischianum DSM 120 TaxID=1150626 RepID=H8FPD2_MAGML|nr:hypothetical protein PHAMO_190029 [Magnetospirillum molischianum DSM 120]
MVLIRSSRRREVFAATEPPGPGPQAASELLEPGPQAESELLEPGPQVESEPPEPERQAESELLEPEPRAQSEPPEQEPQAERRGGEARAGEAVAREGGEQPVLPRVAAAAVKTVWARPQVASSAASEPSERLGASAPRPSERHWAVRSRLRRELAAALRQPEAGPVVSARAVSAD